MTFPHCLIMSTAFPRFEKLSVVKNTYKTFFGSEEVHFTGDFKQDFVSWVRLELGPSLILSSK